MGNSHRSRSWRSFSLRLALILLSGAALTTALSLALGRLRVSSQIAYEEFTSTRRDVMLLELESGLRVNLSRSPLDDYGAQWTDGGARLLYRTFVRQGREDLLALDMNSLRAGPLETEVAGLEQASSSEGAINGPYVYTVGYGQMWAAGFATVPVPIGYGFNPRLSPDGQWVLYYADTPENLNAEAYIYNVVTRQLRNLTQHPGHDWSPAWSPDGTQIAFASARDGNAELYVVDVACAQRNDCARSARRLTITPESELGPSWSPDGRQIIYARDHGAAYQLFALDVLDGTARQITSGAANHRAPVWRP
jgi:Tol biopolymer transport system component